MDSNKFNKWFSAFIMGGLTIALVAITAIRLVNADGGEALMLFSVFGSIMGVLSVVLSANGKRLTFFFGVVDVTTYGIVCLINWYHGNSGLGNGLMHLLYFVPMQFVGLAQWKKRGNNEQGSVKARRLNLRQWGLYSAAFLVISVVAYCILLKFDRSNAEGFLRAAVILDTLPFVCNILGQILMSTAYMEQWIFWIGVNITSLLMWGRSFAETGDSFSLVYLIKYVFFFMNAVNGLRVWIGLSKPQKSDVNCKKQE